MVDVIPPHNWVRKIFHPNSRQGVSTDLIVFVGAMSIVCYVKTYVFAVTYVTESDEWFRTWTIYADSSSNYEQE